MSKRWDKNDDLALEQIEAELRGDLRDVREAATVYAERTWERGDRLASTGSRPAADMGWTRWAGAAVAAGAMLVGGARLVYHSGRANTDTMRGNAEAGMQPKNAAAVSDEALLEQIQGDLSTGVPAAMEPLVASDARAHIP